LTAKSKETVKGEEEEEKPAVVTSLSAGPKSMLAKDKD
jgi:hypothetical protein